MTTYNTGNPVPSGDPFDRFDNSQTFDEVLNSDADEAVTRLGEKVKTLAWLENAVNGIPAIEATREAEAAAGRADLAATRAESSAGLAAAATNPFNTITEGLLNTSGTGAVNRFFSVPGTGAGLTNLYRNDVGAATLIGSSPSTTAMNNQDMMIALARTSSNPNLAKLGTRIGGTGVTLSFGHLAAAFPTSGIFVSVNLGVTGAAYPSLGNDLSVFASNIRVQAFAGSTLVLNQTLVRLPNTKIWYYRDSTLAGRTDITEVKVQASAANIPGLILSFDEPQIYPDSGIGFSEVDARKSAILASDISAYETTLLDIFRQGPDANLLTVTSGSASNLGVVQLSSTITPQVLPKFSAAVAVEVSGAAYPELAAAIGLKAEVVQGTTIKVSSPMLRIGSSHLWYVRDFPAIDGPHTSVKITATAPSGATVSLRSAVFVSGGLPLAIEAKLKAIHDSSVADALAAAGPIMDSKIESAVAGLQTLTPPPGTALEALGRAASRRVSLVMLGDSNQLKDGYGFSAGLLKSMTTRFGEFATGFSVYLPGGLESYLVTGAVTGAPPGVEAIWPPGDTAPYGFVPDGSSLPGGGGTGLTIKSDNLIGVNNALRIHFAYSSFPDGAGSFRGAVRAGASPFTQYGQTPVINTNTGSYSMQIATLDLPAESRNQPLECKFATPGNTSITGPFAGFFIRAENVAKVNGISVHTLHGVGGASLYDFATAMNVMPDKKLAQFFSEVRRLQISAGQEPIVVIYINSGVNDLNENLSPSLGYRASTSPTSSTAYIDNLEAISKRLEDIWQKNGWNVSELFFLACPSHPISSPDSAGLVSYRKAAWSWAANRPRGSAIDLLNLTSFSEMYDLGLFQAGNTDFSHLTFPQGYDFISNKITGAVPSSG